MAEFECNLIRERTLAGLEAARAHELAPLIRKNTGIPHHLARLEK